MSESRMASLFMSPRVSKLIQSLRETLQKIEEDFPSQADQSVVATLKRLLLLRIAELESDGNDKSDSINESVQLERV
jgi:hypothetical protein